MRKHYPYWNIASRVFILLAYLLFFSVQLCFRYTSSDSIDLDAYSSIQAHSHGTAHATLHTLHKSDGEHSILNKRFQPVDVVPAPALEFEMGNVYSRATRVYALRNEPIPSRTLRSALLRGPPPVSC